MVARLRKLLAHRDKQHRSASLNVSPQTWEGISVIHQKHLLAFASLSSLAFGLCASPALAQQQTVAPTEGDAAVAVAAAGAPAPAPVDETQIVITAQKRSENVQK